ncbi:hypothetical protein [Acetobacter tropicalis]|uniref:hypothetical protein n=3 Tax=Acetobacter tropicalis TaxID=104102 RepID=UPI0011BF76EB|nr:hypothetical protein [Acetobacter tropicalis]
MSIPIFILLFYIATVVGGYSVGERINTHIFSYGYVLWMLCISLYSEMATQIISDCNIGCIEQIMLSKYGFSKILYIRAISSMIFNLINIIIIMILLSVVLEIPLRINIIKISFSCSVLISALSMGFIAASYALFSKKLGIILLLGQFIVGFLLVWHPLWGNGNFADLLYALPIYMQAHAALTGDFRHGFCIDFITCLMSSFAWLLMSVVLFKYVLEKTIDMGSLHKF